MVLIIFIWIISLIFKLSSLSEIPQKLLKSARIKDVYDLSFKHCYIAKDTDGKTIGIAAVQNRLGRTWLDTYWIDDISKNRHLSFGLWKMATSNVSGEFIYLEMELNNPLIDSNFYENCHEVSKTATKIIYKRKVKNGN